MRLGATASLVLMQPTTLCNLDCTYCYLPDRATTRVMSVEVADAVAEAVTDWSRTHPVRVLWHGGEPLATGLTHFATLISRFGPGEGHLVRHGVQTNATLIDDRWCELFATVPVDVAVSIDGTAPDNTAQATAPAGRGELRLAWADRLLRVLSLFSAFSAATMLVAAGFSPASRWR